MGCIMGCQSQDATNTIKPVLPYLEIKLRRNIRTTAAHIRGCVITALGKIIITDSEKKCLMGFNVFGTNLFTLSTGKFVPFDIACISDTNIAVTSGSYKEIRIIDINDKTIKNSYGVSFDCFGVTYAKETLFVCAASRGILSFNLTTMKETTILHCELPAYSYITTHKNNLYFTNYESSYVTCCDMEGNTLWAFNNDVLHSPRGITTDYEGRVYVCDYLKHQVIVLSWDEMQNKQIISRKDGLCNPQAIHFDKRRNRLLVANTKDNVFNFLCIPG